MCRSVLACRGHRSARTLAAVAERRRSVLCVVSGRGSTRAFAPRQRQRWPRAAVWCDLGPHPRLAFYRYARAHPCSVFCLLMTAPTGPSSSTGPRKPRVTNQQPVAVPRVHCMAPAPGERPGTISNETENCLTPGVPVAACKDLGIGDVTTPTLAPFLVRSWHLGAPKGGTCACVCVCSCVCSCVCVCVCVCVVCVL